MNTDALLLRLDAFSARDREAALRTLAAATPFPPAGHSLNLHMHSFFSYNAAGASPAHLAYDARRAGLWAAGLCDFDVLDGLDEFLRAGLILGLRTAVHLETRVFVPSLADREINSPGEPDVAYLMGAGFAHTPKPTAPEGRTLSAWRRRAAARNQALIDRINRQVPEIAIALERDVLPLTPRDAPTERHLVRAYCRKAAVVFPADRGAAFWARTLGRTPDATAALLRDTPALEEQVRAAFVKRGGLGYTPPTADTFPPVADFLAWVRACGAIPMLAWLDGTSAGESDPEALLDAFCGLGVEAVNLIPERNWNVRDPAQAARKQAALHAFMAAADARGLPVNIGTELNRDGLPFADDLTAPALAPHADAFRRGAALLAGHTTLLRYAGFGYTGDAARARFGDDRVAKNRFFEAVGRRPPLTEPEAARLTALGPEKAFDQLAAEAENP